jgi:predicted RNase H-like HicB family nuclease
MRKIPAKQSSLIVRRGKMSFTAVFLKVPEGYVGFVEELPGANTQGATLEETRKNIKEAVRLILEANRNLAEKDIARRPVIREKIEVSLRVRKICRDLEIPCP